MLELFVGAASPAFSCPYFVGYSNAYNFSAGILFTRDITQALHFESLDFIRGNEHTAAQSISYVKSRYSLTGSAGVLVNSRTINGAGTVKVTKALSFSASHSDVFLYNPTDENVPIHTSLNAVGANFTDGFWTAHDMYIESNTGGVIQGGNGVGGGVHFRPVVVSLDYFVPKTGHSLLVGTVTEKFGRHVSVSEFVSNTNGQTSFNGGGTYTSNELTVSLGYTVDYFPATNSTTNPFQQVMTLSVSFHAPHSSTINLGSVVLPNRKVEYSVGGSSWFQGPMEAAVSAGGPRHEGNNGKYEYVGVVKLENGAPLEGAAVLVGKNEVFTDDRGTFVVRSTGKSEKILRLIPADFTTPIDYECVNCPEKISTDGQPVVLVVKPATVTKPTAVPSTAPEVEIPGKSHGNIFKRLRDLILGRKTT